MSKGAQTPQAEKAVPKKAAGVGRRTKAAAGGKSGGAAVPERKAKRRDQQRAIETRQAILQAALSEFAERGFDAASIRNIGARTGLQHPLITYHYRTKEILWKAVAENAFAEIRKLWDDELSRQEGMTAVERLRTEYSAFLHFTVAHPDFHHFMLRESRPGNPRLPWLVDTILRPTMQRLIPQIETAQGEGSLPPGDPALIHYMMIGMTAVLSSLKDEIQQIAGIKTDDPKVVDSYLKLVDAIVFHPANANGAHVVAKSSLKTAGQPRKRTRKA
jgi:TetR/AcrR family transcriptional regulator